VTQDTLHPHRSAEALALVAGVPTGLYIGGAWVASADGRVIDVTDPATGDLLASVADGTVEDGLAAVAAAYDAGPAAQAQRDPASRLRTDDRTF